VQNFINFYLYIDGYFWDNIVSWQGGQLASKKDDKDLFLSRFSLTDYKVGYKTMLNQRLTSPLAN